MTRPCRHQRVPPAARATRQQRARASIEARYGRTLTDDEWTAAASNVRQLVMLLASWERKRHVVLGANDEANDEEHD
jgi:hypothetical protein